MRRRAAPEDALLVIDVALNPRVAQLLGRIEETRRLAQDHPEGHPARVGYEAKVAEFYAEVGRYVHWLVRQDPSALARLAVEGRRWADELGEHIREELIPEVSFDVVEVDDTVDDESVELSVSEMSRLELTGDSRAGGMDVRDLGEVEPLVDVDVEAFEGDEDDGDTEPEELEVGEELEPVTGASDVEEITGVDPADVAIAVRTGSFPAPVEPVPVVRVPEGVGHAEDVEWVAPLRELLAILGAPAAGPTDRAARAAGVRSVALATTNVETRWAVFPSAVQQALLGLVGARARRLEEELSSDPDVRLAMGRLRRYAEARGLALVPALREGSGVARNWAADERRYWTVLNTGM